MVEKRKQIPKRITFRGISLFCKDLRRTAVFDITFILFGLGTNEQNHLDFYVFMQTRWGS